MFRRTFIKALAILPFMPKVPALGPALASASKDHIDHTDSVELPDFEDWPLKRSDIRALSDELTRLRRRVRHLEGRSELPTVNGLQKHNPAQ